MTGLFECDVCRRMLPAWQVQEVNAGAQGDCYACLSCRGLNPDDFDETLRPEVLDVPDCTERTP